ncbi:MAG: sugar ABC transporter permease, partial [Clostridia bacterium]|nr:sugar ABC transporter permease [Clostridia bacterium]
MSEKTASAAVKEKKPFGKKPVARKDMSKVQWVLKEMKRNYIAYIMCAPFFLIFFTFTILPVILSLYYSFTIFNLIETEQWVWFDNYIRLFLDDDIFLIAVQNTLIFAVIIGPVSYMLSLFVAWFINELSPRIRAVVTLIFYAPSISGGATTIWTVFFSGDSYGYANSILMRMGLIETPIQFFQNATYVMPLCIVIALWSSLGTSFLAFIGGLQTIDKAQFEAAAVDGIKNRWQELWYVTLPNMKPQLLFGAILAITSAFGFGAIVDGLAGNPSVDYCAWTIVHHLGDYGGARYEIGYSSAIATILFAM